MSHLITAVLAILFSGTAAIDSLNSVDIHELYVLVYLFSTMSGTPCNGLSCYYTHRHDRIWNPSSDGKCTCNDTTNLNIQPACHETTKPLWSCIRSTDTVYVTRWKRMELFQKDECSSSKYLLPAKSKLLSLKLSSSIRMLQ